MELATLALILLCVVLLYLSTRGKDSFSSIPGPFRLPILGNLQFDFPHLHLQFTEFAARYGDIYRIQILSQPAIVINSYEAFKEAYSKNARDFVGRPHMLRFNVIGASNGVAFRDSSPKQSELRTKFTKAVGMQGLAHLDELVNENLTDLVEIFKAQNGKAFDPKVLIKKFLFNIILVMVFGEKLDYEDEVLDKLVAFNEAAVEAATIGKEDIDVWSWTKPFNPNYKLAVVARQRLEESVLPLYYKFKETYVENHQRGTIDQYIAEVRSGHLTDADVEGNLVDYFVGGVETTATTLTGFLLILLRNPKIQRRLQADVDEAVGRDRLVHISDKVALPFAEACVLELFRYQSILPILVPRRVVTDTELCGYKIPQGTWVYTNAWAIHHNEEVYEKPFTYRPERFLDYDGNIVSQQHIFRRSLVTFGMGGRKCIGEQLAKTRLFLAVTTLMQHFTFETDSAYPPPSDDARNYKLKIIFDIDDYKLKAISR